jgi:hypothetical protein
MRERWCITAACWNGSGADVLAWISLIAFVYLNSELFESANGYDITDDGLRSYLLFAGENPTSYNL